MTVEPTRPDPIDIPGNKPWLPPKIYDFLKLLAMIIMPAVATAYFALAGIWGLPDAEKVIGTVTTIDTFLGILLSVSKAQYLSTNYAYDGQVVKTQDPNTGKINYSLEIHGDPEEVIDNKDAISLKVSS